jgi:protein-tyrosine phosphatase
MASDNDVTTVCVVKMGKRLLTNAVFLLGSYMLIKLKMDPQAVWDTFRNAASITYDTNLMEYRDASSTDADFALRLLDCWQALQRAADLGWIQLPEVQGGPWGRLNLPEHEHYDSPLNGNFAQVVPGKLIAFRSPMDLPDGSSYVDVGGTREFSPSFLASTFASLGVTRIIRLSRPTYDPTPFEDAGANFHHLPVGPAPPARDILDAFLAAAAAGDSRPGHGPLVAVHCHSGLGWAAALIGAYLVRECGFPARAAVAWLRIVRPGSVVGAQPRFLCAYEAGLRPCPAPALPATDRKPVQAAAASPIAASNAKASAGGSDGGIGGASDTKGLDRPWSRRSPPTAHALGDSHATGTSSGPRRGGGLPRLRMVGEKGSEKSPDTAGCNGDGGGGKLHAQPRLLPRFGAAAARISSKDQPPQLPSGGCGQVRVSDFGLLSAVARRRPRTALSPPPLSAAPSSILESPAPPLRKGGDLGPPSMVAAARRRTPQDAAVAAAVSAALSRGGWCGAALHAEQYATFRQLYQQLKGK